MTEVSNVDFLRRLKLASLIKIVKILTDDDSQLTDCLNTPSISPASALTRKCWYRRCMRAYATAT